jgi:hypothetical protein
MSKNLRTASGFGGVGGGYQPSPFSPGNTPFGLSGKNRGGHGINPYINEEDSFTQLLEKMRQGEDQSDLSIESKLLKFHKNNVVSDSVPYLIEDPAARRRAKFRQQLNDYALGLQQEADSIIKNTPAYINKNTKKDPDHYRTIEQSLEASKKHRYKPFQKFEFEDDVPEQIKPERYHYSSKNNIRISEGPGQRGRITRDHPEDAENGSRNVYDQKRFNTYPEASYPLLSGEDGFPGLNNYLNKAQEANQDHRGTSGYNEPNINDGVSDDTKANVHPRSEMSKTPLLLDENESLEANLNGKNNKKSIQEINNQSFNEENSGLEKQYNTFGIGIHGNSF